MYTGRPILWYIPPWQDYRSTILLQFLKEHFGLGLLEMEWVSFCRNTEGPTTPWSKTWYARKRLQLLMEQGQEHHLGYPSLVFIVGCGDLAEERIQYHRLVRMQKWIRHSSLIPNPVVVPIWLAPAEGNNWIPTIPFCASPESVVKAVLLGFRFAGINYLSRDRVYDLVSAMLPDEETTVGGSIDDLIDDGIIEELLHLAPLQKNQGESDEKPVV